MVIYKYHVQHEGVFQLDLPKGAQVLSYDNQGNLPCMWALVDPNAQPETRTFFIVGTGHPIEVDTTRLRFIGTALFMDDRLVYHLFEVV